MAESQIESTSKLKYGKYKTQYNHYTALAAGTVTDLQAFSCPNGNAYMGMKMWVKSFEDCVELFQSVGMQIGFSIADEIEIYETEPIEPPAEHPYAYDINFNPF
ncbi:hypothetical protein [Pedobacter punctiformis]|uniref:Phage protein n=1 Tax=Pedobacter punctiformis TaxID=3004097 RepID=A0ABT4L990_9SPHI|nr:hypothetical protein [Pedobacter sp. HCMS5-2]MCZ4244485.1 hypothetical protein [Pedobacter sp. HCMS5-2]